MVEWETPKLSRLVVRSIPRCAPLDMILGRVNVWDMADTEIFVVPVILCTFVPLTQIIFPSRAEPFTALRS